MKLMLLMPSSKNADCRPAYGVRRRWLSVLGVAFFIAVMICADGGSSSNDDALASISPVLRGSSSGGSSHVPLWVKKFPLSMDVPRSAFAVLGEGIARQTRWGVYAFRGTGQDAGKPCMDLATLYFGGGEGASFKDGVSCGDFSDPARQIAIAQSGFSIQKSIHGPTVGDTVFGMIVVPSVTRLHMDFEPGPSQTRATRLLSARQAAKANIEPFRYLTFGIARVVCLSGVVGMDSVGGAALEVHPEVCE